MNKSLTATLLSLLGAALASCTSYDVGERPLTQSEISYFSKVDPSAAVVTYLGGNTFDVYNPTAPVGLLYGGWSERIPFTVTRYTSIGRSVGAMFPNVYRAYSRGYEACRALGLEALVGDNNPEDIDDLTFRFKCLDVSAWVSGVISDTTLFNSEVDVFKTFYHPCYVHESSGDNESYIKRDYCDAYTAETGFRINERFSRDDLAKIYEQKAIANRRVQESISSQDQCKAFGFTDDTPEMANCLLELYKIANQPQQNTVITNSAPARTNSSDTTSGIELMNRGLQILNEVGTPSAPRSRTSTCTRIGDISGQVVTFNNIACPAGYAPTF